MKVEKISNLRNLIISDATGKTYLVERFTEAQRATRAKVTPLFDEKVKPVPESRLSKLDGTYTISYDSKLTAAIKFVTEFERVHKHVKAQDKEKVSKLPSKAPKPVKAANKMPKALRRKDS